MSAGLPLSIISVNLSRNVTIFVAAKSHVEPRVGAGGADNIWSTGPELSKIALALYTIILYFAVIYQSIMRQFVFLFLVLPHNMRLKGDDRRKGAYIPKKNMLHFWIFLNNIVKLTLKLYFSGMMRPVLVKNTLVHSVPNHLKKQNPLHRIWKFIENSNQSIVQNVPSHSQKPAA